MTSDNDRSLPWHSYEPMERYNSLFPILPDYVPHYTLGGKRLPRIALASKRDLGVRKGLLATLLAHRMGIGISYAEKRYGGEITESRWLGLTDKIDFLFAEGRKNFEEYLAFKRSQIARDDKSFRYLSANFFYRSLGSLDAAKRLSELGYLCEVAAILRTALEQFAFCSKLQILEGSEDLKTIKPIQCLNHFKKFVPAAGQLYGLMSKYTHFEYDHHTHFFSVLDKELYTIQKGSVLRAYATQLLFTTMICVGKYILISAPAQYSSTPRAIEGIRIFIEKVDEFSDEVCRMLPLDTVLANVDMLLHDIVKHESAVVS